VRLSNERVKDLMEATKIIAQWQKVRKPAALPFNTNISDSLQHYDPFLKLNRNILVVLAVLSALCQCMYRAVSIITSAEEVTNAWRLSVRLFVC